MLKINEDDSILQQQIKKRLNDRNWSCRELAKAADMSESTARDIVFRGRQPYTYNLRRIADALNTTMDELTAEDKGSMTKAALEKKTALVLRTLNRTQVEKVLSYALFLRQGGDM